MFSARITPLRVPMGPFLPGLAWAHDRLKITQKWSPTALRQAPAGFSVPVHGQNPLVGCFLTVFSPFVALVWCLLAQFGTVLGPDCVLQSETEDWLYLGLDRPNRDSERIFARAKPHF